MCPLEFIVARLIVDRVIYKLYSKSIVYSSKNYIHNIPNPKLCFLKHFTEWQPLNIVMSPCSAI